MRAVFAVMFAAALLRLISMDDAADELGVSKRYVRRLIATDRLKAYRVGPDTGRVVRIKSEDVLALLRPVTPSGKDW